MAYAVGQFPTGFAADASSVVTDPSRVVIVPIPVAPGPEAIPWAQAWVSFAADFGIAKFRYAVYNNGTGSWRTGTINVDSTKGPIGIPLKSGDSVVSLARMKRTADDTAAAVPVAWFVQAVLKA